MIRFDCPHCGKGLRTDSDMAGKAFNCPTCRGRVSVPEGASANVDDRRSKSESGSQASRFKVHSVPAAPGWPAFARPIAVAAIAAFVGAGTMAMFEFSWLAVALVAAIIAIVAFAIVWLPGQILRCPRCRRRKVHRSLGVIHRDAPAAREALEVGDLAALGALSHEGEAIQVSATICTNCNREAPIEIEFITVDANRPARQLAHVVYPGAALPAFERLCQRENSEVAL